MIGEPFSSQVLLDSRRIVVHALAQEWFDVVTRIWNHDGPFDWNGRFYKLKGIYGFPRPYDGQPPIMNAAGSQEGRQFAARNADFLFKISIDVEKEKTEVDEIRARATALGRQTGVFTLCHMVCRPTRKEAEEYYHYAFIEQGDWSAVDGILAKKRISIATVGETEFQRQRHGYIHGMGGLISGFISSPEYRQRLGL